MALTFELPPEADTYRAGIRAFLEEDSEVDLLTAALLMYLECDMNVKLAAERLFVLDPWLALDADAVLPGAGRVDTLAARLREGA